MSQADGQGKSSSDLNLCLSIKSLQVYCDYDCESYIDEYMHTPRIIKEFLDRWKTDVNLSYIMKFLSIIKQIYLFSIFFQVHFGILLPFDMDVFVNADITSKPGNTHTHSVHTYTHSLSLFFFLFLSSPITFIYIIPSKYKM